MDTGPTSPAGTPYGDISDLLARMGGEDEGEPGEDAAAAAEAGAGSEAAAQTSRKFALPR